MRTPLTLPPCLAAWIDRNMPDVEGVGGVALYCCDAGDMPFDWLGLLFPTLKNRRGFALWGTVYLDRATSGCCPLDPCDFAAVELVLHELCHVESYRKSPLLFPVLYLVRLAQHGYAAHPDEAAANARAAVLRQQYQNEDPCGCRPSPPPPPPPAAHALTQPEIDSCCGSPQNQEPTIDFAPTRTPEAGGTRFSVVVTARQACGIRKLTVRPFVSHGTTDVPLPEQTSPGGDCLSFRTLTVTRSVASGASLKIVAEATNCCGKTASRTMMEGA